MAVRDVLLYPDARLKQAAAPVQIANPAEVQRTVVDLIDTMRSFTGCVGIAAPQIGEMVRIAVVDVSGHRKEPPNCNGLMVLINPRIDSAEGSAIAREGCLSIPQLTANVKRATEIKLASRDLLGRERSFNCFGFEARCVLHELDHLDGKLFLDRVASFGDDIFVRKH